MKEPNQQDLIRRRLLNIRMRLYATPQYLEKAGVPHSIQDLASHRLICQNPQTPQVSSGAVLVQSLLAQNMSSTLMVNNYLGVLQGVVNHIGIGVLPDYLIGDLPNLTRVLPSVESGEVPVFLAFPEELRTSRRVAAFRDFVLEEIQSLRKQQAEEEQAPDDSAG